MESMNKEISFASWRKQLIKIEGSDLQINAVFYCIILAFLGGLYVTDHGLAPCTGRVPRKKQIVLNSLCLSPFLSLSQYFDFPTSVMYLFFLIASLTAVF